MKGEIKAKAQVSSNQESVQVVAFNLGNQEYAVDILNVQEINRLLPITRVPRTENFIEGVVNLRGNIIPIINLHKKFELQATGEDEDKRIIFFQFDDLKVGIIVDEVSEVLNLSKEDIEEKDNLCASQNAPHVKGVARVNDRLLILLDILKILEP